MKLLVIRHGQTELNNQKKFYGALDVSLNKTGFVQAQQLAYKLKSIHLDLILCSGLQRSCQTAKFIIHDHLKTPVFFNAGLNEISFGRWEGLNANEIKKKDPVIWQKWLNSPFNITPEGAESFNQFKKRVISTILNYLKKVSSQDTVLLISHLGPLRTWHHFLFPQTNFWQLNFLAGCYSVYELLKRKKRLISLNV